MTTTRRTLLAAVCAVAVASIYASQAILPQIGGSLDMPDARLGWIVAAGQLGYLVGLGALVPLGDLIDRRRLIAGHLLLTAASAALVAAATRAWVLLAGLMITGLFAVVVQTTVAYAAAQSSPAERGRNVGAVTAGVVIGILAARVAAGVLAAVWGWRSVYLALAILLATLAFLVVKVLPTDERAATPPAYRHVLAAMGGLIREPLFVSRGLIAFFLFASFGTLWSGLTLPLEADPWRLSTAQVGLFGLSGLAGALGASRAGRWADAGFAKLVTGAALALLGASWLAIGQASWSLWLVVVGVFVLDFAVQTVHVSNQHLLTTRHVDRASSVIGGYMIFYSLGSALGATTTTTMYGRAGWTGSSILGAVFAVGALLVWASGRRMSGDSPARKPPAEAHSAGIGPGSDC